MTAAALVLFALAAEPAEPAEQARPAFGRKTAADVRGIDPDNNRFSGDGAYGRFDGDLDVALGLGPSLAFSNGDLALGGRVSAHWFSVAGLYLSYAEAISEDPVLRRRFSGGLDLRPLFLVRWPLGLETGPALLDLTLDSLSLGLGLLTSEPRDPAAKTRRGFEMSLGFGVPLTGRAPGPWIELRAGLVLPKSAPGESTALALFSWHFVLGTPFVASE